MEFIINTSDLPTKGFLYRFKQIIFSVPETMPAEPTIKPAPIVVPNPDQDSPWIFPLPKKDSPPKGFFF